jgi:hypothetical protein
VVSTGPCLVVIRGNRQRVEESWAAASGGGSGEKKQRNAQCWKTLSISAVKAEAEKTSPCIVTRVLGSIVSLR